ncbi:PTS sugar transporter subunit IIA [bacterium]|nr:PTS sugar transporter subunit IIA [bacterium]
MIRSDDYVTSGQLAELVGVSARTVREDLKALTSELAERGVSLDAAPSKGYRILKADLAAAKDYLTELAEARSETPDLPVERQRYILRLLLFESRRVNLASLEAALHVSRPTLEKDMGEAAAWLRRHKLELHRSGDAIEAAGPEVAVRYAMVNFCQTFSAPRGRLDRQDLGTLLSIDYIDDIERQLRQLQGSEAVHISTSAYAQILLYLAVAASRLAAGHQATVAPEEIPALASQNEFKLALRCLQAIEAAVGLSFPDSEVMQFSKVLMQANIIAVDQTNLAAIADDRTLEFVNKAIFKIQTHFNLDLTGDRKFINSLVLYLRSKRQQDDQLIMQSAPTITEIEREYPRALEISLLVASDLRRELDTSLSEAEIGELALFVCAAIERGRGPAQPRQVRVAIVCAAGKGGSQLLSAKIERSFGAMEVLGVFPGYRLAEVRALAPDLVLSTIPPEDEALNILQVSPLLTEGDLARITEKLHALREGDQENQRQLMLDLFDPDLFFPGLALNSPEAVIEWMGGKLHEMDIVDEAFTGSVLDRETLSATSIGNLVAIPHAFLQQAEHPCIAVATLQSPVRWGEEKVQLVLLLNISTSQEKDFKPIFSELFRLLSRRKKVLRLIRAAGYQEFIKELNE